MTKTFKKPDLNAPRYRPRKCNLLNVEFHKKFIAKYPRYADLDLLTVKKIVSSFNGALWQTAVDYRDGIELPEQLGYVFIGTCPKKKGDNPNYYLSLQHGIKTQNQNWESDQYIAKIFYTNFETKYKFKNHELWGFTAVRDFKRTVAHVYPQEWKKYLFVDNKQIISRIFRKQKHIQLKQKTKEEQILETYDEFSFD